MLCVDPHCVVVVESMSRIRSGRKHRCFLRQIPPEFVGVLGLYCGVTLVAVSPRQRRTSRDRFRSRGAMGLHFTPTRADTHTEIGDMFI